MNEAMPARRGGLQRWLSGIIQYLFWCVVLSTTIAIVLWGQADVAAFRYVGF